jgi:hypothetical protein
LICRGGCGICSVTDDLVGGHQDIFERKMKSLTGPEFGWLDGSLEKTKVKLKYQRGGKTYP